MTISSDFGTSSSLPVQIEIPGYRLRAQVGSDALGLWFDAEQESLGRKVTIKVLRPEHAHHPKAHAEFAAEMDRLMTLDHATLVRVLDTERGETPVLVVERVGVRPLAKRLEDGSLGPEEAFVCARDIARALRYLDGKGLAHRNVSPSLIEAREGGGCRLLTFRFIITREELAALKGKLAQDANYIAPEQLGGPHAVDVTACTYQVGALLFHMLSGRAPHSGGVPAEIARKHFTEPFPSLKTARPFLHPAVYRFVDACTAREPDERPDLDTVIDALQDLEAGKDPGVGPVGTGAIALRPRKRRRRRRH